jgi:hypothetical protein
MRTHLGEHIKWSAYLEKFRRRENLMEVPNLAAFDEKFHTLFAVIRRLPEITSFEAFATGPSEVLLKLLSTNIDADNLTTQEKVYERILELGFDQVGFARMDERQFTLIKVKKL